MWADQGGKRWVTGTVLIGSLALAGTLTSTLPAAHPIPFVDRPVVLVPREAVATARVGDAAARRELLVGR